MKKQVINDLFDYKNKKIVQDEDNFKFSLDSILLAEFVKNIKNNFKILDMCTGNAPVPLILSTKTSNKIVGFEIQKHIYDMAVKSVSLNGLNNQIKIINDDIKNIKNYFPGNNFDIITCNPPYFKCTIDGLTNNNEQKAIARHEITINLKEIIEISAKMLNNKGILYLVHRATRLDEIIYYCLENSLSVKEIQPIITNENKDPHIILIKAVKNGNYGTKLRKSVCVNNKKTYQGIFNRK